MKSDNKLRPQVVNYIVSPTQIAVNQEMVGYDILGTIAHVIMLYETKILSLENAAKILKALKEIDKECYQGKFSINPQKGSQLTLEAKIIEKAGEIAGLSAHTARSRNDQAMVAELLYLREKLLSVISGITVIASQLLKLSKQHTSTVFPGYTHMQPAKPTTFAHWCLAINDELLRVSQQSKMTYEQYNLCPLGAAESFGTSWPINRKLVAELLGFSAVWEIPLDAISSRGFFQLSIISCLNFLAIIFSKIATDLLLFSSFEYGLIDLGEGVSQRLHPLTGSSIMAQKKNPDVLELIRSIAPQITGIQQIISGILTALPSGYNRDSREIKEYILLAFNKISSTTSVLEEVFTGLIVDKEKALDSVKSNYSLTTDLADYISQSTHLPYRLVYKIIGQVVADAIKTDKSMAKISSADIEKKAQLFGVKINISRKELSLVLDPALVLEKRKHLGGTNSLITSELIKSREKELAKIKGWVISKNEEIKTTKQKTLKIAQTIIDKAIR